MERLFVCLLRRFIEPSPCAVVGGAFWAFVRTDGSLHSAVVGCMLNDVCFNDFLADEAT